MDNSNSSSVGILGVIVGVVIVLGLIYLLVGERLGLRSSAPTTTITVTTPKAPTTKPAN